MSQAYSDPKRESDPYALPDVETFHAEQANCPHCSSTNIADAFGEYHCDSCREGRKGYEPDPEDVTKGWYWWACFPGCLPDGEPCGPFATEAEALADAQANSDEGED